MDQNMHLHNMTAGPDVTSLYVTAAAAAAVKAFRPVVAPNLAMGVTLQLCTKQCALDATSGPPAAATYLYFGGSGCGG